MAVISISRQFGAGGRTLAKMLAQKLGYSLADDALIEKVAAEAGVSDEWVRVTERETDRGLKDYISGFFSSTFFEFLTRSSDPCKQTILDSFKRYIPEMARQGNIIFLGRGSQFILPDSQDVVKILMIAAERDRIAFLMKNHRLSESEARQTVKEWERNRTQFLCKLSARGIDDPKNYNLVINTSLVALDQAAAIIEGYIGKIEAASTR